jgi:hypothetical protein
MPDQRFGQLLICLRVTNDDRKLWAVEDTDLEKHLKECIKRGL